MKIERKIYMHPENEAWPKKMCLKVDLAKSKQNNQRYTYINPDHVENGRQYERTPTLAFHGRVTIGLVACA